MGTLQTSNDAKGSDGTSTPNLVTDETISKRRDAGIDRLRPGEMVDSVFTISKIEGTTVKAYLTAAFSFAQFNSADPTELKDGGAFQGRFLVTNLNRATSGPIDLEVVELHTFPKNPDDQLLRSDPSITIVQLEGKIIEDQKDGVTAQYIQLDDQRRVKMPLLISNDLVGHGTYLQPNFLPGDIARAYFVVIRSPNNDISFETSGPNASLVAAGEARRTLENTQHGYEDKILKEISLQVQGKNYGIARSMVSLFQSTDRSIEGHRGLIEAVKDFPENERPLLQLNQSENYYMATGNAGVSQNLIAIQKGSRDQISGAIEEMLLSAATSTTFSISSVKEALTRLDVPTQLLNQALENVVSSIENSSGVPNLQSAEEFLKSLVDWGRSDLVFSLLTSLSERSQWKDTIRIARDEPWLLEGETTTTEQILSQFVYAFDQIKDKIEPAVLIKNLDHIEALLNDYSSLGIIDSARTAERCKIFCRGIRIGLMGAQNTT